MASPFDGSAIHWIADYFRLTPANLVEPSVLMSMMSHLPAAQVDGGEGVRCDSS